jgi:hypothetical protein
MSPNWYSKHLFGKTASKPAPNKAGAKAPSQKKVARPALKRPTPAPKTTGRE